MPQQQLNNVCTWQVTITIKSARGIKLRFFSFVWGLMKGILPGYVRPLLLLSYLVPIVCPHEAVERSLQIRHIEGVRKFLLKIYTVP